MAYIVREGMNQSELFSRIYDLTAGFAPQGGVIAIVANDILLSVPKKNDTLIISQTGENRYTITVPRPELLSDATNLRKAYEQNQKGLEVCVTKDYVK
ncbi:MAG: hypothetical protein RL557_1073 [archaeon]|jgi:hypothetical protein